MHTPLADAVQARAAIARMEALGRVHSGAPAKR